MYEELPEDGYMWQPKHVGVTNGFSVLYVSVLKYQHNLNKHISA